MFVILNHKMTIEENMMEDVIGDAYVTWKEQRYRFIPISIDVCRHRMPTFLLRFQNV